MWTTPLFPQWLEKPNSQSFYNSFPGEYNHEIFSLKKAYPMEGKLTKPFSLIAWEVREYYSRCFEASFLLPS
jgi:hypothetical protein